MIENLHGRKPTLIDMEKCRRSAVVIPLIENDKGYEVLFEVRSDKLKRQPGEICFPGGACEAYETPEEGAKREICEELLIDPEQVEIVAPMNILFTPFNMVIYPYLGLLKGYNDTFGKDEVQEVFTVPLKTFLEEEPDVYYNKIYTEPSEDFPWQKVEGGNKYHWASGIYPVLFYEYEGRVIWGMTARIMHSAAKTILETR